MNQASSGILPFVKRLTNYFFYTKNKETIPEHLLANLLFQGLTQQQIRDVANIAEYLEFDSQQVIFSENDAANYFYIIQEGEVKLSKNDDAEKPYNIFILGKGQVVGEESLFTDAQHKFSAVCQTSIKVWRIHANFVREDDQQNPLDSTIVKNLVRNLNRLLGARLESNNDLLIKTLREKIVLEELQVTLSKFMVHILLAFSLYIFLFGTVLQFARTNSSLAITSAFIIILLTIITLFYIKESKLPLQIYGITLNNWKFAVIDSLIFSLPIIISIIVIRLFMLKFIIFDQDLPFFSLAYIANLHHEDISSKVSIFYVLSLYSIYLLLVPFQELIARGCLQNVFENLLEGRYRTFKAILLSNLMFAAVHAHLSLWLPALVFISGMYWGWMYTRHRTLIGVCLSHIVIGVVAISADLF